jgi:hypothetical protein
MQQNEDASCQAHAIFMMPLSFKVLSSLCESISLSQKYCVEDSSTEHLTLDTNAGKQQF